MAVLNFIKSIFIPKRMVKFRYMSILVAICIFIVASYIIVIPIKPYLNRNIDKMVSQNNYYYLKGITEISIEDTNEIFIDLQNKECSANDNNQLECSNLDSNYYETSLSYVNSENRTVNITFVIDLFDSEGKALYNPDKDFSYSREKYPNIDEEDYYLIIFRKDRIYYQAYPTGVEESKAERNGEAIKSLYISAYYDYVKGFNFNNFQNDSYFARDYIYSCLIKEQIRIVTTQYSMVAFFYTVVFTLVVVLLFWLFFKKNGKLKKFKEYYNVAAISSIAPTILLFILMWFNNGFIGYYIFGFSVYYLFVLYRINNSREIA